MAGIIIGHFIIFGVSKVRMQDAHDQRRECSYGDYHSTIVTLTCYARINDLASNTRGILCCLLAA